MRLSRLRTILVAIAACGSVPGVGLAQVERVYSARGVVVDQTAQSAAQARDAAIAAGQRQALRQVFERVAPRADVRRLPNVNAQRLTDLVASFEVEDERVSATRYLGKLTVRFKPDDVRDLLRNANIAVAETFSKPIVVLPVLQVGDTRVLWEDPNPWRDAWAATSPPEGLTPLVMPAGDVEDAGSISVDEAIAGSPDNAAKIAKRYQAQGVLVVIAKLVSPTSTLPIRIDMTRIGADAGSLTGIESFARRPREDDVGFFRRAVAAAIERNEESWKSDVALQFGREARLVVTVPFQGLRQWVATRQQLASVAAVRKSEVISIGQSEAVVEVTYIGDENQLKLALSQRNLDLSENGGRWLLQAAGTP